HAVQPSVSPDGAILIAGVGPSFFGTRKVVTRTLDLGLPSLDTTKAIANYPDTAYAANAANHGFPVLSPRQSYDGTRLALGSKQVYAARRNMNLPPQFVSYVD